VAALVPAGNRRENLLMVFGPLSLILLLAAWAVGLVFCFALFHWGANSTLSGPADLSGFFEDFYLSGTTFFTLGLGDVTPRGNLARTLTVLESGMGFAFLALVIGYLPMISQAFSRRETNISMLDARAGSPSTAAQLMHRHSHETDDLHHLLNDWERWSAELLESHVSFPVLAYFRSQHDNQSWVAALTTILDSCCLAIARVENAPVRTARLTFAMALHAVVDLCRVFHQAPLPPAPDRLPPSEEERLEKVLTAAGYRLKDREACAAKFHAMRAMYEPYVNALAVFLLMPLPDWVPPEGARDNWQAMA
jgi:hypothetical protein